MPNRHRPVRPESPARAARGLAVALALLCATSSPALHAQGFPSRPLRVVVPFAPGGSNDIVARLVAPRLAEALGQPVTIENRAGASGMIGAEVVVRAPPDGHLLLVHSVTLAVNATLIAKPPFDIQKDLAPVTLLASAPLMLVVHPSLPVRTVRELIALAKARPGQLLFGSGGQGSTPHLAGELLKSMARVELTHVAYKGGGPALADLVGGHLSLMIENIPSTMPLVKSGRLRAIAVAARDRTPLAPDLPTFGESGLAGYEVIGWNGLFGPAGLPADVARRLHTEIAKVLALPDVRARFVENGATPIGSSPEEFAAYFRAEIARWGKVVRDANVKLD